MGVAGEGTVLLLLLLLLLLLPTLLWQLHKSWQTKEGTKYWISLVEKNVLLSVASTPLWNTSIEWHEDDKPKRYGLEWSCSEQQSLRSSGLGRRWHSTKAVCNTTPWAGKRTFILTLCLIVALDSCRMWKIMTRYWTQFWTVSCVGLEAACSSPWETKTLICHLHLLSSFPQGIPR